MDPLFADGGDATVVAVVLIKTLFVFVFLLIGTMLMVWFERKLIGDMQNRIGPNRAGPFGLLQPIADGIKLALKQGITPKNADLFVYLLAPILAILEDALATGVTRSATLLFGAREQADLYALDEIERIAREWRGSFRFVPVLSGAESDASWNGERGLVAEKISAFLEHKTVWHPVGT